MKAVILVGGQATRLIPLTHRTPKAMVPVVNTPFLEHVIRHLARHHVEDIILAQGHLAKPMEGYLGDGSQFGVRLSYAVEDRPLGTAGAVKYAAGSLDGTFLVMNGDIFTDLDISAMIAFHRQRNARATIALTPVNDPSAYGLIETNPEQRVLNFLEKPQENEITTNMINAGTYVLEPDILNNIPPSVKFSFERDVFPQLLTAGELVAAYPSAAYWIDIGTPAKYAQLHWDLLDGKCQPDDRVSFKNVLIGDNTDIHPSAQIEGPVVIGANCFIGRQVKLTGPVVIGDGGTILEESVVEKSVVWRNVRLGPRAKLKNSIIADNCCLNAGCFCQDSVLGDNVTVVSGYHVPPNSQIEPGTVIS